MITSRKAVAVLGIAVVLLAALLPLALPVFVSLFVVGLVVATVVACRRIEPEHIRPALLAIRSPQHLPRAGLPFARR